MTETQIITTFNKILCNLINKIKFWHSDRKDVIGICDDTLILIKSSYRAGIDNFDRYIYNQYGKKINDGDRDFFAKLDLEKIASATMLKFFTPLKALFLEASNERKEKIFTYVKKLVRCCKLFKEVKNIHESFI